MKRQIYLPDALYGTIEYGPARDFEWDMFQTEALARLRDVSLCSTPSRLVPHGTAASRFQHSAAVANLAYELCTTRPEFAPYQGLLTAAGLCHDAGSPPFSHISEPFMYDLTGRTHEEQTLELLSPGQELHDVLTRYEVDPAQVVEMVTGRHPLLGPVVAGSIDLDNLDNTIHLLASFGYTSELPYHPLRLVQAFRLLDDQVCLDSAFLPELLGWAQARRTLYTVLRSEAHNSSSCMLYRALEFAYADDALDSAFFSADESDALGFLRTGCSEQTAYVIDQALTWHQYPMAFQRVSEQEDPRIMSLYGDWQRRKEVTDRIAEQLNLRPEQVAFYAGRDRGEKSIKLPFVGAQAGPAELLFGGRAAGQQLAVFCHKSFVREHGEQRAFELAQAAVDDATAELPETPDAHTFF